LSEWIPVPEKFIEVDAEKCNGCGRCVTVCAANVYKIKGGKARVVNPSDCFECYACVIVCKPDAIEWRVPKGGTGIVYKYG
jgi:ferredoxin-like protein FixX